MQDANDFINFGHNAINNLQMSSDKAQDQEQTQAHQDQEAQHLVHHHTLSWAGVLVEWAPQSLSLNAMVAISRGNYQLAKLMLITWKIYERRLLGLFWKGIFIGFLRMEKTGDTFFSVSVPLSFSLQSFCCISVVPKKNA